MIELLLERFWDKLSIQPETKLSLLASLIWLKGTVRPIYVMH